MYAQCAVWLVNFLNTLLAFAPTWLHTSTLKSTCSWPCRPWCIQAFWNVLSTRWIQAAAFGGSNTTPLTGERLMQCKSLSCGIQIRNQALLAKSGVAPQKVLFVDDAVKNIQSVRRCFFGHVWLIPQAMNWRCNWLRKIEVNHEHQSSFAKCCDCSDLFANSSAVVFSKKKMGRKDDLWNSQSVLFFFAGLWVYVQYICLMGFRTERGTLL